MRPALLQLQKFGTLLHPAEWVVVVIPPIFINVSLHYLASFYIALGLAGLISLYSLAAVLDHYHTQRLKKRNKRKKIVPKLHYSQTMQLGLLSLLLDVVYLAH